MQQQDGAGSTGDNGSLSSAPRGPGWETGVIRQPAPPPEYTPRRVPCLRNCFHYTRIVTHYEHGNPAGTFLEGREPKEVHHYCRAFSGEPLELSADCPVLECSAWHPEEQIRTLARERAREDYYRENPDHRPPSLEEMAVVDLDEPEETATHGNSDDRRRSTKSAAGIHGGEGNTD